MHGENKRAAEAPQPSVNDTPPSRKRLAIEELEVRQAPNLAWGD